MDYADDVRMSERGIKEMSEAYRKIRNTFRYLLGNLEDYARLDPSAVAPETLHEIDRWALGQLNRVIEDVTGAYERFEFYRVYQRIYQFCAGRPVELLPRRAQGPPLRRGPRRPRPPRRAVRPGAAARRPDPPAGADHPAHGRGALGLPPRSPGEARERPPGRVARARPGLGRPRARRADGPPPAGARGRCSASWRSCGPPRSSAAARRRRSG